MKKKYRNLTTVLSMIISFCLLCGVGPCNPFFSISGSVTGAVQEGVTLLLTGVFEDNATTDADGNYIFETLDNGTYTIVPRKSGYAFSPDNQTISVIDEDITSVNFTSRVVYAISGTISGDILEGVIMTLSGDATTAVTSNAAGNFVIEGLDNGTYTVTPSLSGYIFTPVSQEVVVDSIDETDVAFTAAKAYAISGTVSGAVQSGVTISLTGGATKSTSTDAVGGYSFAGLVNGSYTVTPGKSSYTFSPTSRSVTISDADQSGINFTATEQATGPDIEMVSISAGTFMMGCTPGDTECYPDESPRHSVTLSSFEIGKYEVTQGQWEEVMGSNPSDHNTCGDDCPVEQVSWDDVQTFITELNSQTGSSYRLCTEAEWEYAARAGTETKWYCGDIETCLSGIAWYETNSGFVTHPVGQKSANTWGLYDMTGNVWEWVYDRYGDNYYNVSPTTNPTGPVSGADRVFRGGSSFNPSMHCRSAIRGYTTQSNDDSDLGVRLCR